MRIQPKLFELMIAGMLLTIISTGSYAQDNCLGKNFNTSICDDRTKFMASLRGNHLVVGEGSSTLIIERVSAKQTSALAPGSILVIKGPSGIREIIVPYASKIRIKLPKDPGNMYTIQVIDPQGLIAETNANTYIFRILDQSADSERPVTSVKLNASTNDQVLLEVTKNSNQRVTYTYDTLPTNGEYFEQQGLALSNDNRSDRDRKAATGNLPDEKVQPESQGIIGQ